MAASMTAKSKRIAFATEISASIRRDHNRLVESGPFGGTLRNFAGPW
jgi:hypothetical protein